MSTTEHILDRAAIRARLEALPDGYLTRVLNVRTRTWELGTIRNHRCYPLSEDEFFPAWSFVEHSRADILALLAHIRAQAQRIAVLEADAYQRDAATRQDERNATIKDMRRHLADELRKLSLCDQETISLTEVVDMVRQQNDRIAALEDALLDGGA